MPIRISVSNNLKTLPIIQASERFTFHCKVSPTFSCQSFSIAAQSSANSIFHGP